LCGRQQKAPANSGSIGQLEGAVLALRALPLLDKDVISVKDREVAFTMTYFAVLLMVLVFPSASVIIVETLHAFEVAPVVFEYSNTSEQRC